MRFILVLLLLVGLCGAADYGDINIRQGSNLSYVDDGGTTQNFDMATVPTHGELYAYNYSDTEYEPVTLGDPTTVTVGELSLTNPKTWLIDYKVHSTIPGCYATMAEALQNATDDASGYSTCYIDIAPGNYSLSAGGWEINIPDGDIYKQLIIDGHNAWFQCVDDGIIINKTETNSRFGNLQIQNIYLNGSEYTSGGDGFSISESATAVPKFILRNCWAEYFNVGFNMSGHDDVAPCGCSMYDCYARFTNVGIWIDGCHNSLINCIGDYNPQGSDSVGIRIAGNASANGAHTLIGCDGGKADTGLLLDAPAGGNYIANYYFDGSAGADTVAINVSRGLYYPNTFQNFHVGNHTIEVGLNTAYAIGHFYGVSSYHSTLDYSPNFHLGANALECFIENYARARSLQVTDDGAYSAWYQGVRTWTSGNPPGISTNTGCIGINVDPATSEAGFKFYNGASWLSGAVIPA